MILLSKVASEAVQEREYFLMMLEDPFILNGIRIGCVAVLLIFLGTYQKYKKKQ